jgi:hypothetical protein
VEPASGGFLFPNRASSLVRFGTFREAAYACDPGGLSRSGGGNQLPAVGADAGQEVRI